MQIKDRVFIVTGASSGIGLSMRLLFPSGARKSPCSLAAPMRCKNWRGSFQAACRFRLI